MGVDTILKIDDKFYSLDRWYIFESEIEHGKEYNMNEVIKKINIIKNKKNLYRLTYEWEERQSEAIEYYIHWLCITKNIIKYNKPKSIIFFKDSYAPDECFKNKHIGVEKFL